VSDVTYVRTENAFIYLSVIMDLYSRKIVGYHSGDNLEASGCIRALEMALRGLGEGSKPIHHSDRGCQYCCHEYVDILSSLDFVISMTEENHCYENAHVERLHGILKQEYGLGCSFKTKEQARKAIDNAVWVYNTLRPHGSLGNRVPEEVHGKAA
jgi:transposase InsO family protein